MVLTVAGAYKGDYGHFRKVRLSGYLWPGGSQVWPAFVCDDDVEGVRDSGKNDVSLVAIQRQFGRVV